ncbi:MAG: DUF1549 domain-containing protein, partial [Spirochaetia bacterium]|nr:DUF1549 domain-containing protein [Spirochaetia bacterium]
FRQKKGVKALGTVSDDVFIRRVYLDLAGRIPTLDETRAFLDNKDAGKREKMILSILNSEDYTGHFFNFWGSLLRVQSYMQGMAPKAYENWVKASLRDNLPYDEWVRRMVAAKGAATEDNGAVGFIVRDRETGILDAMSETSQVFLGSQIGCAMCHNAKFEKWKQREFYALAAYYGELQMFKNPKRSVEIYSAMKGKSTDEARKLQREFRELPFIVFDKKGKELDLPANYAYEPADAGKPIRPAVLYGKSPEIKAGMTRREAFAQWLTSPENPNFTRTIANRLWGKVFGVPLVDPPNDLSENNPPRSQELLGEAERLMTMLQYDMKSYLAVLAFTRTYQLSPSLVGYSPENYAFDSHPLRRMMAEELRDSLTVALTGKSFPDIRTASAKMGQISSEALQNRIEMNAFGKPGEQMNADKKIAEEMASGMMKAGDGGAYRGAYGTGVLSCDQFFPVRAGTFLDQFGASRRDTVTDGTVEANIAQVLTLMNGAEMERLVQPSTKNGVYAVMSESKDNPKESIKNLFLVLYQRLPTEQESKMILEHLGSHAAKALPDIVWALANNREFYFVQ